MNLTTLVRVVNDTDLGCGYVAFDRNEKTAHVFENDDRATVEKAAQVYAQQSLSFYIPSEYDRFITLGPRQKEEGPWTGAVILLPKDCSEKWTDLHSPIYTGCSKVAEAVEFLKTKAEKDNIPCIPYFFGMPSRQEGESKLAEVGFSRSVKKQESPEDAWGRIDDQNSTIYSYLYALDFGNADPRKKFEMLYALMWKAVTSIAAPRVIRELNAPNRIYDPTLYTDIADLLNEISLGRAWGKIGPTLTGIPSSKNWPIDRIQDYFKNPAKGPQKLDLRNAGMHTLPPELFKLDVHELILDGNSIVSVGREINRWENLTKLSLENCNVKQVNFGGITPISELNLARNNLIEIPPSLKYLADLKILDLSDNPIVAAPKERFYEFVSKQLEVFDGEGTRFAELSKNTPKMKMLEQFRGFDLNEKKVNQADREPDVN
jgi:hypothetical protein